MVSFSVFIICFSLFRTLGFTPKFACYNQNCMGAPNVPNNVNNVYIKQKRAKFRSKRVIFAIMERLYTDRTSEDSKHLVLDDFDQLLDAIFIFNKEYGDFEIPVKFEVPDSPVWPAHLHGLRLGKRLEKLFTTSEFFDDHPEKVKEIEKIGLKPSIDSLVDDFGLVLRALKVYKSIYGNLRVPAKFVCPATKSWPQIVHNVQLGARVAAIRSSGRFVRDKPERKQILDDLGFEWRLRDPILRLTSDEELFEQIYQGLVKYKELRGNINVPEVFIIPEDDSWPPDLHGFPLGTHMVAIRQRDKLVYGNDERTERLRAIGFEWKESAKAAASNKRFDEVYRSLLVYKEIYGDLYVPQSFIVPNDPRWPEDTWGLRLGGRVNTMRSTGALVMNYPERRAMLDDIGFCWELPTHIRTRKGRLASADAPGASDVSAVGEVEGEGDPDASSSRGSSQPPDPSGDNLSDRSPDTDSQSTADVEEQPPAGPTSVPVDSSLKGKRAEIDAELARWNQDPQTPVVAFSPGSLGDLPPLLGGPRGGQGQLSDRQKVLSYDPTRMFEPLEYRELISEAMLEYMRSQEMSEDPDIRDVAHFDFYLNSEGYHRVTTRYVSEEDEAHMKAVGYRILEFGKFYWEDVLHALKVYRAHYGDLDVPQDYVINESVLLEGVGFPEEYEDMQLGEAVAGIRIGDIDGYEDPERRAVLDALGFVWGDKDRYQRYRFVPLIYGLKVYNHLNGYPMPPHNFVVPDQYQWPTWMVGMPLGEWSSIARVQQRMIREYYPERYEMFNALDYLWWLPPGPIPDKYFEPLP